MKPFFFLVLVTIAAACSGGGSVGDAVDASDDLSNDAPADVSVDAPADILLDVPADLPTDTPTDGPVDVPTDGPRVPCGTTTCSPSQACVQPCCGGAAPACDPRTDAGTCPPGDTVGPCFGTVGEVSGCTHACTPAAPFCVDVPASCAGTPACGCFGSDPCSSSGSCGFVTGRDVSCLCA